MRRVLYDEDDQNGSLCPPLRLRARRDLPKNYEQIKTLCLGVREGICVARKGSYETLYTRKIAGHVVLWSLRRLAMCKYNRIENESIAVGMLYRGDALFHSHVIFRCRGPPPASEIWNLQIFQKMEEIRCALIKWSLAVA